MKELGYGRGYAYDHDAADGVSGQDYWPEGMAPQALYEPSGRGAETGEWLRAARAKRGGA
jgi:putative ATPase